MLQGLKLDEMLNNGQSDEQYLNSVLSRRDLMYSNRDIVNAKTNFSQEYLSNMYISNKYNNQIHLTLLAIIVLRKRVLYTL